MPNTLDRYAVIGHPIEHSRSPEIHALFAQQTGERLTYDRLAAPPDGFAAAATDFFAHGGAGLNVTLPFKQEAAAWCDRLSARASNAGAVNTLKKEDNGNILGDNTDGAGLLADLVNHLGITVANQRILILGAGGAVRGVVPALLDAGALDIMIANRTLEKAKAIMTACGDPRVTACGLDAPGSKASLVINAISAGLSGSMPALPADLLANADAVYDMLYADQPTPFLRWACENGVARQADGFGMLVEQAAESFALWRGIRPETAPIIARLRPNPRLGPYTV
ncbi:MAG: shikimate dehydrogenase [Salinisphaera sp.]|nr:shikimate dehydrogenase [Salinisphaera sp.]